MKNVIEFVEDHAEMVIVSPKHGTFRVKFDIADLNLVETHKWYINKSPTRRSGAQFDARANVTIDGRKRKISLHRHLMGGPPNITQIHIDHIDGFPLDNRRSNLRWVTNQENQFNTKARGYYWNKRSKKWHARIRTDGRLEHLGYFDTTEAARAAYLEAKALYHIIADRTP